MALSYRDASEYNHSLIAASDVVPAYYYEIFMMFDNELVISWPDLPEITERSEQRIIKFYWDFVAENDRMPTFRDVCKAVESWNSGVFYQAAAMEEEFAGANLRRSEFERGAEYWSQMADVESLAVDMEHYICHVLTKFKLTFFVDNDDEGFWADGMLRINLSCIKGLVVNDAQNLLLPEFARVHQVGYDSHMNYYPRTSSLLMLEGGR